MAISISCIQLLFIRLELICQKREKPQIYCHFSKFSISVVFVLVSHFKVNLTFASGRRRKKSVDGGNRAGLPHKPSIVFLVKCKVTELMSDCGGCRLAHILLTLTYSRITSVLKIWRWSRMEVYLEQIYRKQMKLCVCALCVFASFNTETKFPIPPCPHTHTHTLAFFTTFILHITTQWLFPFPQKCVCWISDDLIHSIVLLFCAYRICVIWTQICDGAGFPAADS